MRFLKQSGCLSDDASRPKKSLHYFYFSFSWIDWITLMILEGNCRTTVVLYYFGIIYSFSRYNMRNIWSMQYCHSVLFCTNTAWTLHRSDGTKSGQKTFWTPPVSFIQIETHTRMHTETYSRSQLTFSTRVRCPGWSIGYWPWRERKKNITCTKQSLNSSNNSWGTFKEFDSKMLFIHFRYKKKYLNYFARVWDT